MTTQPLRKEFKVAVLPATLEAHAIYYVKGPSDVTATQYVTEADGTPVEVGSSGGGGDATAIMAAHEAASDPHPGYMTSTEANAVYVRTVNGTGPDEAGDVVVSGGGGGAVESVNGVVPDGLGNVALDKGDMGLGNVDNTSDAAKPVSTDTQTALNLKANAASPSLTGITTIDTPATGRALQLKGGNAGVTDTGPLIEFGSSAGSVATVGGAAIASTNEYGGETNGQAAGLAFKTNARTGSNTYTGLVDRMRIASTGQVTATPIDPAFSTLTTVYDGAKFNIGGFPITKHFGGNTTGMIEALVGAVLAPAGTNFSNHVAGVAGYAESGASGANASGAVGIYGQGTLGAVNGAWGANFVSANNGIAGNLWGAEFDVNNTGTAAAAIKGIAVLGGSDKQATGITSAVRVEELGVVFHIRWKIGFDSSDAASDVALYCGTLTSSNGSASQPIQFRSRSAGGTEKTGTIKTDSDGNFIISGGAGSLIQFQANGGAAVMTLIGNGSEAIRVGSDNKVGINCTDQAVALDVNGDSIRMRTAKTPASATASGVAGQVCWDSSYVYVCTATNTWKRAAIATW